ncbi:MAG TPA: DUF2344 domain-containing protein [Syntrophomonadaceae bacterium]|nr:DUF2344 domain-containing protein [Syntrophomonadaceae bacterium]
MPKYRIAYAKIDLARFLSHLEVLRTLNRALRRSGLPLAYTEGFNPHPKVSFGPSLGVGVAGLNEYFDLELEQAVPLKQSLDRVGRQFPQGLVAKAMAALPPFASGLSRVIDCAWYRVALPPQAVPDGRLRLLKDLRESAEPWLRKRQKDGKVFDVKRGILDGRIVPRPQGAVLDLLVKVGEGEVPLRLVLEALWEKLGGAEPPLPAMVTRVGLYRLRGGQLVTPLGETRGLWEE